MHVHEHEGDIFGNFRELAISFAERIINRSHEHAALQIEHGIFHAILRRAEVEPAARIAVGKICGTQQPRLMGHKLQNLFFVPAVIAAAKDGDIRSQQLFGDPRGDAKSRRRVLAIGDDQVDLFLRDNVSQPIVNDLPSRRADNVSHKQYAHVFGDWWFVTGD